MRCKALLGPAWLFHLLVLSQCVCDYKNSRAAHLDTSGTCPLLSYHYRWALGDSKGKAPFKWRRHVWTCFSICCFPITASCTKPLVSKPLLAELQAVPFYFKEPAKRETQHLVSRSSSDASIFHVMADQILESCCATDMRLRRSESLRGAPAVESSSCYCSFSECTYTEMQNGPLIWQGQSPNREAGGGWERIFFFFSSKKAAISLSSVLG